jgi:hypothetical protein
VSDVIDLLTEAFSAPPAVPAEARLTDSIAAVGYWSFQPSLEVVVAEAGRTPVDGQAVTAWRRRLAGRPIPLVLLIDAGDGVVAVGPSGNPPPVLAVDPRLVTSDLADARGLDPLDVRRRLAALWRLLREPLFLAQPCDGASRTRTGDLLGAIYPRGQ